MKPEMQKPFFLATALAMLAASCSSSVERPTSGQFPESTAPTIERCTNLSAEALRPPTLSKESVVTYPGGIIVNQAGSIADFTVNLDILTNLNKKPLELPTNILNVTYFFHGTFERPDAVLQMSQFFNTHRSYLLARYCQEQKMLPANPILSGVSVYDVLREVSRENPNLARNDRLWVAGLEKGMAVNYLSVTKITLQYSHQEKPQALSSTIIGQALEQGLPFKVTRFNLNALEGLAAPSNFY